MESQPAAVSASERKSEAGFLHLKITMEHLWLGIPIFVLVWKCFMFPAPTLDFWWHLKLGEVIATMREIPRVDLFSFTAAGKPFIVQNWLAELSYYAAYWMGGLPLLMFFNAALLVLAYLPIYSLCLKAGANLRTGVVISVLAVLGSICNARPQVFSFVMFGLYYWVLERYRLQRKDLLWTLPVLMAFWINLHGAFVIGIGLIGIYIFSEGLRRLINPTRVDALSSAQLQKLAFMLMLCVLATLANPESYRVYDYVRTVMVDAGSQQFVLEWQPPRIDDVSGLLLFYGPFLLTVVVLIYSRSKPDFTELCLFLLFAVFGMKSLRNGVWFTMVAYPILARYAPPLDFRAILTWLRRRGWISGEAASYDGEAEVPYYRLNLLFAALAIAVLTLQSPWVRPRLYNTSIVDAHTPTGAMDFISEHKLAGNIFHPQTFGDYLIWRLWPLQKSFIDGRVHIFGVDFVKQYQQVFQDMRWEELLKTWDIRYLLLSKDKDDSDTQRMIHSAKDSGHWTTLYEDDISILLQKTPAGE